MNVCILWMLYFDRIEVSGVYVNQTIQLMLIKELLQKSVIFVTIGIS